MTLQQLTEIIKITKKVCIISRLTKLGYIDCKKDKKLCKLSIETLFKGSLEETDTFPDSKDNRTYQGGILTNVVGYEHLEFVIVNINDYKNTFPIDMLIWVKAIER